MPALPAPWSGALPGALPAALLFGLLGLLAGPLHAQEDFVYAVQPGDHPWNLAQRYLKDPKLYLPLARHNRIADDRRIAPGTRLRIPQDWLRLQATGVRLFAAGADTLVLLAGGASRAPVAGEVLQPPMGLRTGAQGSATLEFADGSRTLVRRDSELRLVQAEQRTLGQASLVRLELLRGGLENSVRPPGSRPDAGTNRFEIRSPAAVAAVRGTEFRVSSTETELRTEVLSGAVEVANAAGRTDAAAGTGSLAQAGQAPRPALPLLPAPALEALPERIERLPIDWPVPAVAQAQGYRTQFAADAAFTVMQSDEVAAAPRLRARDVEDGRYVVRMRAVDADGIEGRSSERTLEVRARPEPPLLIEPAPQSTTEAPRPAFRWTQAQPAHRYRWQLSAAQAQGSTASQPLQEQLLDGPSATAAQDLAPGLYQWRVATIDAAKGQGPWGDAQPFRRVLPGPGVAAPEAAAGALTLRWSAQPQTRAYRVQIAREADFAAPLADAEVALPQHELTGLAPGRYHVRVHSVGEDGYAGPWGPAQSFSVAEPPKRRPWEMLLLLLPLLLAL